MICLEPSAEISYHHGNDDVRPATFLVCHNYVLSALVKTIAIKKVKFHPNIQIRYKIETFGKKFIYQVVNFNLNDRFFLLDPEKFGHAGWYSAMVSWLIMLMLLGVLDLTKY